MSSSVFYKFKNSREPERIVFDGTGISVFELKHDIIVASGLGDGTDFNLHMYPEDDLQAEYKDDTILIPRSATVVCVRRPAPRGQGRAARYLTGKAPQRARTDTNKPAGAGASAPTANLNLTEADAEAAFLAASAQQWDAQKESLAHAKPVYNKNKKPVNVPTHDPPPGYVCRRCNVKGHWIQACPTNDDPDFKPVFQAKRTTGIPRSFQRTVEKPVDEEAAKGIMLNAEGEYVQVMTDTKTWEKFQEKTNASKVQAANADAASKEMRERGLECPIDKRRFVDPVKTPCCSKTYCRECIDNALAEGDLICPNCGTEEVLMDNLEPDEEMVTKLRDYDAEKAKEQQEKQALEKEKEQEQEEAEKAKAEAEAAEKPASPNVQNSIPASVSTDDATTTSTETAAVTAKATSPAPATDAAAGGNGSDSEGSTTSKKRKEAPTTIMPPSAPKAMRQQKEQEVRQQANSAADMEQQFIQQMEALKNGQTPMMPMGMGMPPTMPMNMNMNNMGMGGFQPGMPFPNPMGSNFNNMPFHPQQGFNPQMGFGNPMMGGNMMNMNGMQGGFGNQQQYGMGMGMQGGGNMQGNDAYERQPVNNRNRNRKQQRQPDYRYL